MTEKELAKLAEIGIDIELFQKLEEQGKSTLIQRISLFVEQERKIRAQQEMLEEQLHFLLQQKHAHYDALEKHSENKR